MYVYIGDILIYSLSSWGMHARSMLNGCLLGTVGADANGATAEPETAPTDPGQVGGEPKRRAVGPLYVTPPPPPLTSVCLGCP